MNERAGSLALCVNFALARGRASLELSAHVRSRLVRGANEAARGEIDHQGCAVPVVHPHVAAVADEHRQLVGALAEPRVICPSNTRVPREEREATRATAEARGRRFGTHLGTPRAPVVAASVGISNALAIGAISVERKWVQARAAFPARPAKSLCLSCQQIRYPLAHDRQENARD